MHYDPDDWPDPFEPDPTVYRVMTAILAGVVLCLLYMALCP